MKNISLIIASALLIFASIVHAEETNEPSASASGQYIEYSKDAKADNGCECNFSDKKILPGNSYDSAMPDAGTGANPADPAKADGAH